MRITALTALVALLLAIALPATAAEPEPDPWIGKKRGEIISMLGKPDRAKGGGKRETLTYRFVRVSDDKALPPGIELVALPGVEGAVGRLFRAESAAVSITGTNLDARGRLSGEDGMGEDSRSITWNKEDGKTVSGTPDERSSVLGKCTVKFKLSGGRVTEWSVTPPSAKKNGEK